LKRWKNEPPIPRANQSRITLHKTLIRIDLGTRGREAPIGVEEIWVIIGVVKHTGEGVLPEKEKRGPTIHLDTQETTNRQTEREVHETDKKKTGKTSRRESCGP
jgi:hypothetical protein